MTKAALEAAVNALLPSGLPITAGGQHRPSMQQVIDELYDAQSRGDVLAGVTSALTMQAGDLIIVIRSGAARIIPFTALASQRRGAYALNVTNQYPAGGGSGAAGAILAGDWWYVSVTGTLDLGSGAEDVPVKSIVLALVDTPGTDPTKWRVI